MTKKSLQGEFMTGPKLTAFWQKEFAIHKDMLKKMGAIK